MNLKLLCAIFTIITVTRALSEPISRAAAFENRIVGGNQTSIDKFPYQISLLRAGTHICGGSIIGSRWVLTAAHCVYGIPSNYFAVRVGSSNKKFGGTIVNVKSITQHPNFNRFTIDFDYALVELNYTLPSSKKVQKVNLPAQNAEVPDNAVLAVTGWGNTLNDKESNVVLRVAKVPYVNHETCDAAYSIFGGITSQMICAGFLTEGGKDSCQGDSGGPLVGNNTLYGVVSWGFDCAQPNYPGVYAKVSAVRNWIRTKTGI